MISAGFDINDCAHENGIELVYLALAVDQVLKAIHALENSVIETSRDNWRWKDLADLAPGFGAAS